MKRSEQEVKMENAKQEISSCIRKTAKEFGLSAAEIVSILTEKSSDYIRYVISEEQ